MKKYWLMLLWLLIFWPTTKILALEISLDDSTIFVESRETLLKNENVFFTVVRKLALSESPLADHYLAEMLRLPLDGAFSEILSCAISRKSATVAAVIHDPKLRLKSSFLCKEGAFCKNWKSAEFLISPFLNKEPVTLENSCDYFFEGYFSDSPCLGDFCLNTEIGVNAPSNFCVKANEFTIDLETKNKKIVSIFAHKSPCVYSELSAENLFSINKLNFEEVSKIWEYSSKELVVEFGTINSLKVPPNFVTADSYLLINSSKPSKYIQPEIKHSTELYLYKDKLVGLKKHI